MLIDVAMHYPTDSVKSMFRTVVSYHKNLNKDSEAHLFIDGVEVPLNEILDDMERCVKERIQDRLEAVW